MTKRFAPHPLTLPCLLLLACTPTAKDVGEDLDSGESSAASEASASMTGDVSMSSTTADTASASATTASTDTSDDDVTTDDTLTSAGPTSDADSDSGSTEEATTSDPGTAAMVLFVNFDGATLIDGADDSRTDTTSIADMAGEFAAYAGGDRAEVFAAVEAHWAPFAVLVTDARPADGDYTMVMAGPTNPFGGGIGGIGPLDCENANPNNIGFAFMGPGDGLDTATRARFISHTAGDTLGLDHVSLPGDLMDPAAGGDEFLDECGDRQSETCLLASDACPDGQQSSFQELATRFGLD